MDTVMDSLLAPFSLSDETRGKNTMKKFGTQRRKDA
jgi:hypothetical protein